MQGGTKAILSEHIALPETGTSSVPSHFTHSMSPAPSSIVNDTRHRCLRRDSLDPARRRLKERNCQLIVRERHAEGEVARRIACTGSITTRTTRTTLMTIPMMST